MKKMMDNDFRAFLNTEGTHNRAILRPTHICAIFRRIFHKTRQKHLKSSIIGGIPM